MGQQGQEQQARTVVVLTTGGTIAGQGAPGRATNYHPGAIAGNQLLAGVPGLADLACLQVEEVCRVNSDDVSGPIWLQLASRINTLAGQAQVAGFVVVHGTDTLEETAFFLHLTVKTVKPVVLTGAMRPATALSPDGPMNLYQAVALAADPGARGLGVLAIFNGQVLGARELIKESSFALDAFSGGGLGCLGYLDEGGLQLFHRPARPHTQATEFFVDEQTLLPVVNIAYFAVDADPGLLTQAAAGAAGLVLAGAGAGEYSRAWQQQAAALAAGGLPIVRCSRLRCGDAPYSDEFDHSPLLLRAHYLPPHKARILLQLALLALGPGPGLQEVFDRY